MTLESPALTVTDPPRKAAFAFIFAASLLNSISFGILIPILPSLIKQFVHGDTAAASDWNVLFSCTWGAMQFICGPILGMLSDRYGRRPVMLISIFGLFIDFLFMAFAPTLLWLFVGRVLNGLTASSFSTANAYVADITPPDKRARNFGLLGSAFGFGFIIGPTVGGVLGDISLRLPFMLAAGLCLLNGIYGLLVLPESLPRDRRTARLVWTKANPVGSLIFLRARRDLLGLAGVVFLAQLAQSVLPTIFVLYTSYRFHWNSTVLGLTFMASGISQIGVQIGLVGPAVKRFGERGAVLLGSGIGAFAYVIYALAPNAWIYLIAVPVFSGVSFLMPGVMGLMSRKVDPKHQGQLQGVNQSFQGIASMIGPLMFGELFSWAVRHDATLHLPGFPILIAAALLMGAFVLGLGVAHAAPAVAPKALAD